MKSYPLPEAIKGEIWKVKETQRTPFINHSSKEMHVPLDIDIQSQFSRNHEMFHVKFTSIPPKSFRSAVPADIFNAVEDARIHALMNLYNVNTNVPLPPLPSHTYEKDPTGVILAMVSTINMKTHEELLKRIPNEALLSEVKKICDKISYILHKFGIKRMKASMEAATWLWEYLKTKRKLEEAMKKLEELPVKGRRGEIRKKVLEGSKLGHRSSGPIRSPDWGKMTIEDPEKPLSLPTSMLRRYRPADSGTDIRYPHLLIEQLPFARRTKLATGSMLIDVSGSMSLKEEDVEKIMQEIPMGIIAVYSGGKPYPSDNDEGILRIIAKNGKRCKFEKILDGMGSGNIIDLPALQWLKSQKEPRIWISDGLVTGIGDEGSEKLTMECEALILEHRIIRIRKITDAIKFLKHYKNIR